MSLVGTPIVFSKLEQDVLLWMVDNEREYCYTAIKLTNNTGAAVTYRPGKVITSATLADGADPKTIQGDFTDALLMQTVVVPANSTANARAIVRGPAICNLDAVEKTSDGETDASVIARVANLVAKGIQFVREPSVRSTPLLNT